MARLTFRQIQQADRDWPRWLLVGLALLVLYGAAVEMSGNNPVAAVGGLVALAAILVPTRRRALRRRLEARKSGRGPPTPQPPEHSRYIR